MMYRSVYDPRPSIVNMGFSRTSNYSGVGARRVRNYGIHLGPVAPGREIVPYAGRSSILPVHPQPWRSSVGAGNSGGGIGGRAANLMGGFKASPGRYIGGGALGLFALSQGRRAIDSARNGDISNTMVSGAMAVSAGWAARDLILGRGQMVNALQRGGQMLKLNSRATSMVNRLAGWLGK